jgi:hypothetical protein
MACPKCHSIHIRHVVLEVNSPSAHGVSCFICGHWLNGITPQEMPLRENTGSRLAARR